MSDSSFKERLAHLEAQARAAKERHEAFLASYHHNVPQLAKEANDAVSERAEAERQQISKFDPIELLKQLTQMREEGVSEEVIRAAFNEAMNEARGAFRIPLRRVLRTADSIPVPPQEEINKMYIERYKGINLEDESGNSPSIGEIIIGIRKSEEVRQQLELALKNNKVSLKTRLYRLAYVVLRRPLQFLINFLVAFRQAKHDTSNQIYRR